MNNGFNFIVMFVVTFLQQWQKIVCILRLHLVKFDMNKYRSNFHLENITTVPQQ